MNGSSKSGWRSTTLGDVLELFDRQRIPLSGKVRRERQGPYPYYGASGIIDHIDDYIFDGRYLLVAEDGENLNSRKLPIAFFATGRFWVNNHAHIARAIVGKANDDFIKAWLDQANISGYITGTAQPKLSQANLKRISLSLPPLPLQDQIASILSAYDDLIENNLRRIEILEEMAQALYREWFVEFRFPGHEGTQLTESPDGPIPESWSVKTLEQIASVNKVSLKPKSAPNEIVYVAISSVSTGQIDSEERMTFADAPGRARRVVQHGDTIWSNVRPNLCAYALVLDPAENLIVSTGFSVISPEEVPYSFLYYALTTESFVGYLVNHARGTAYPAVGQEDFTKAILVVPGPGLLNQFHSMVEPMSVLAQRLRVRNRVLTQARDLLLPRLISGELDVSELDINAGEAA